MLGLVGSFRALVTMLEQQSVPHQVDGAAESVYIPTRRDQIEAVQVLSWRDQEGVLQLVQGIPLEVSDDKIAAVESGIARLNHAMPVPGLDLNHASRALSYRVVLPLHPRGSLEPREIQACFRLAVRIGADLLPSLRRLVAGEIAPGQIVEDVKRTLAQKAPPADEAHKELPPPFWLADP